MTLLKVSFLLCFGWDLSPAWHQGLKGFEGRVQLASTSPEAGGPSSSLVPEGAASTSPGAGGPSSSLIPEGAAS